jgi:hypothetical protein
LSVACIPYSNNLNVVERSGDEKAFLSFTEYADIFVAAIICLISTAALGVFNQLLLVSLSSYNLLASLFSIRAISSGFVLTLLVHLSCVHIEIFSPLAHVTPNNNFLEIAKDLSSLVSFVTLKPRWSISTSSANAGAAEVMFNNVLVDSLRYNTPCTPHCTWSMSAANK